MKFVILSAFLSIFLQSQSRFFCWPVLVMAISLYFQKTEWKLYLLAFILGILSDLAGGNYLGGTSLLLLFFVFATSLLKLRFQLNFKLILYAVILFEISYFALTHSF